MAVAISVPQTVPTLHSCLHKMRCVYISALAVASGEWQVASGKWQVASGGDVWATLAILDALLLTVVGHHIGHERPCGTQLEDWNLGASLAGPPMVKQIMETRREGREC